MSKAKEFYTGEPPAPEPEQAGEKAKKRARDPELAAIARVADALTGLGPDAQERVVSWARARFGHVQRYTIETELPAEE